jgi:hypothetical protein
VRASGTEYRAAIRTRIALLEKQLLSITEELYALRERLDASQVVKPGGASDKPVILEGSQEVDLLVLHKSRRPHRLQGEYFVGKGKTLRIMDGARIICREGSELSIGGGVLSVEGTAETGVVFSGRKKRPGYWKGITLRNEQKLSLNGLRVHDAIEGLRIAGADVSLDGCHLTGNEFGAHTNAVGISFKRCVVSHNTKDGIHSHGKAFKVVDCTITFNGEWGMQGTYYGSPLMSNSILSGNKAGGLTLNGYRSVAKAERCMIFGNQGLDVRNTSDNDVDFKGNYWGSKTTRTLKRRGATHNLDSIKDGRDNQGWGKVIIGGFLERPPSDCGAGVSKVRGKSVLPK